MINAVSKEEFLNKIEALSCAVFRSKNVYLQPLNTSLRCRHVLFPCWDNITDALSLESLIQAAQFVGDNACYVINSNGYRNDEVGCLYVPLSELEEAYGGEAGSPNLMGSLFKINPYSPGTRVVSESGQWGIMTAMGIPIAVMGGCEEFCQALSKREPNLNTQVFKMIEEYFKVENDLEIVSYSEDLWFLELLANVYGLDRTKVILEKTDLVSVFGSKLKNIKI